MKMNALIHKITIAGAVAVLVSLSSCYDREQKASEDSTTRSTGIEYAPQMYHGEAYEPLTQVVDREAGLEYWPFEEVGGGRSDYDSLSGHGEWYNSNFYNEHEMNMRQPVPGTVARGTSEYMYDIHQDSLGQWSALKSPFAGNDLAIEEGAELYVRFCQHCHGEEGDGKGLVGVVFKGLPNYHTGVYRKKTAGDIYHALTYGAGAMRSHASQLDPEERWKIAEYIKAWQSEVASQEEK